MAGFREYGSREFFNRDFSDSIGQVGAQNQETASQLFSNSAAAAGRIKETELMAKAYAERARAQSGGGGILGVLGSIGSSFLGPIGGAIGKSIFRA